MLWPFPSIPHVWKHLFNPKEHVHVLCTFLKLLIAKHEWTGVRFPPVMSWLETRIANISMVPYYMDSKVDQRMTDTYIYIYICIYIYIIVNCKSLYVFCFKKHLQQTQQLIYWHRLFKTIYLTMVHHLVIVQIYIYIYIFQRPRTDRYGTVPKSLPRHLHTHPAVKRMHEKSPERDVEMWLKLWRLA